VTREHYYRPDYTYTAGRIVLRGDQAERQSPRRIDYRLRYTDSFPIAVVKAKAETKSALSGLQQVVIGPCNMKCIHSQHKNVSVSDLQ